MYDLNHLNGSQVMPQIISQIISRILSEIVSHVFTICFPGQFQKGTKIAGGSQRGLVGSKWRRRGPKGGKSVLGKGIVDRYTLPRTTVGQCEDPQNSEGRQGHSLKPRGTTVEQFARPQRGQLHS